MEQQRERITDAAAHGQWRRSSSCPEIDCVEVRFLPDGVLLRDSKSRHNQLHFSVAEWGEFLRKLRNDANPATAAGSQARIGSAGARAAGTHATGGGLVSAAAEGGG